MKRQKKSAKESRGGARLNSGPKPIKPCHRKRRLLIVRVTDSENTIVRLAAERAERALSDWIRETLFASAKAA